MSELRAWQSDALGAWRANNYRGIIAAATGTGKTRLAIEAIRESVDSGGRALVVVPTRILQQQWLRTLRAARLAGRRIGTIGGANPDPSPDHLILVAVIDSARTGGRELVRHWTNEGYATLLVVDECHWAGSAHNRGVFDGNAVRRLGLSATPERGDDGFDEILVPSLGETVYRYALKDAMDDGVLSQLRLVDLIVDLPQVEVRQYAELQRKLDLARSQLEHARPELFKSADWTGAISLAASTDQSARHLNNLVSDRRRMLANSTGRLAVVEALVASGILTGRRTIIFNEIIRQAENVAEIVRAHGHSISIDHSRMNPRERESNQEAFRAGATDTMVVVRTADEGLDVPDADQAVIVSGTLNPRQRVQRLGRIVRLGGQPPRAVSLLAKGTLEETIVASQDRELLGSDRVKIIRVRSDEGIDPGSLFG